MSSGPSAPLQYRMPKPVIRPAEMHSDAGIDFEQPEELDHWQPLPMAIGIRFPTHRSSSR